MTKKYMAIARATAVIGGVTALVAGVTFAQLSTTASLTGNTLSSATVGLQVSTDNNTYNQSLGGYNFTGIVPGGAGSTQPFFLQNTGGLPLKLTASIPVTPTSTGVLDFAKIHVSIDKLNAPGIGNEFTGTFADLLSTGKSFTNTLANGDTGQYNITFTMDADAVTGPSAHVDAFDLVFTGTP